MTRHPGGRTCQQALPLAIMATLFYGLPLMARDAIKARRAQSVGLHFLGKRRPSSLADAGEYTEVEHNRIEPTTHDNAPGSDGFGVTGRAR